MKKLTQLNTYQLINSIRLHFKNKSYDFKKYLLNSNKFNESNLQKRNDKSYYNIICNDYQYTDRLICLCASNFLYNPNIWVGELTSNECKNNYLEFRKRKDSPVYYFREDIEKIKKTTLQNLNIDYNHIMNSILSKEFHPYSAILLNRIQPYMNQNNDYDIVFGSLKERLNKFETFVSVKDVGVFDSLKSIVKENI